MVSWHRPFATVLDLLLHNLVPPTEAQRVRLCVHIGNPFFFC